MVPLVILVGWLTHPAMERLSARAMGEGMLKQSVLVETIGGLETVKAAGAGPLLAGRWRQGGRAAFGQLAAPAAGRRDRRHLRDLGRAPSPMPAWSSSASAMIAEQELTMGGLIACSILAGRAIAPLAQISQLLSRMTSTRTAYRQINEMMEMPPEGPEGEALKLRRVEGQDRVPQRRLPLSGRARAGARRTSASPSSRASMSPCSAGSARASRPSPG